MLVFVAAFRHQLITVILSPSTSPRAGYAKDLIRAKGFSR
jgi:hypothetical protein